MKSDRFECRLSFGYFFLPSTILIREARTADYNTMSFFPSGIIVDRCLNGKDGKSQTNQKESNTK